MRYLLALGALAVLVAGVFATLRPVAPEPAAKVEDPWAGTYLKYGEYQTERTGQFGEAPKITITRQGDVYKLSKPYEHWEFKETKKGVLQDAPGGIGSIKSGTMEFSDGTRGRVLRADFCYETFYLFAGLDDAKKRGAETPEKKAPPLKVEEAEKLVRDLIFTENPKMNATAQFPLKDLTTKAVWDRLGAQVFQVTEGVQEFETFVVRAKKVHRIGRGFGGRGVTSLAVADPNGDGRDKLVFAYSWGSGEHRSQVAVFDCLAKDPAQEKAREVYFGGLEDLTVQNGAGQTIDVCIGKQKVGRVLVQGKEGELMVGIDLNDDVPKDVRKKFKGLGSCAIANPAF